MLFRSDMSDLITVATISTILIFLIITIPNPNGKVLHDDGVLNDDTHEATIG